MNDNKIIQSIFSISPYPELFARFVYYQIIKKYNIRLPQKKDNEEYIKEAIEKNISLEELISHLKKIGIKKGDTLIIHSSVDGMKELDANPLELIEALIDLVGENGTLAFPAFPEFDLLKDKDGIPIYDPKRSVAWTGMIPNLVLRKRGAIRSSFPYNPLVVLGCYAKEIVENNMNAYTPHGKNSCWGNCIKKHAKVIYLGTPAYHSLTILHSVNDFSNRGKSIKNFYSMKDFYIKKNDELQFFQIKHENPILARFYSERYTESKLIRSGLIKKCDHKSICIRYIEDSYEFVNKILSNPLKYKFLYIPLRYYKK